MTITDFLLARIAEDEAAATDVRYVWPTDFDVSLNPARVLRECEAKRRIVAEHTGHRHTYTFYCHEQTLEALAAVYSDHPDYDPAWSDTLSGA